MIPSCLLDGAPHYGELPPEAKFVGMEHYPNQQPRYGRRFHIWFNLPCYEIAKRITEAGEGNDGYNG